MNKAAIIEGAKHSDLRGTLHFYNDVDLSPVKRFYISEHPDTEIVRAWQGHQRETKWFHVISGKFKIALVRPDDWLNPRHDLSVEEFVLSEMNNQVLIIPGGHASGFKAIDPGSRIMIFSDFSLAESQNDDFRFDKNIWYKW